MMWSLRAEGEALTLVAGTHQVHYKKLLSAPQKTSLYKMGGYIQALKMSNIVKKCCCRVGIPHHSIEEIPKGILHSRQAQ